MKFSIMDFSSICYQIRSFLRIWSHLLKKSLTENFILCAVSTMRRAKIKPALSNQYAHICKVEFEPSKYLFGEGITKNISKAKDMSKLKKHLTKDYSKSSYNSN